MQIPIHSTQAPGPEAKHQHLRQLANELEATFLSEMLKSAGLGENKSDFSGGVGETQFGSFLRTEQARAMVQTGGLGLAEQIFTHLSEKHASK